MRNKIREVTNMDIRKKKFSNRINIVKIHTKEIKNTNTKNKKMTIQMLLNIYHNIMIIKTCFKTNKYMQI
jgi:hypothetical protein